MRKDKIWKGTCDSQRPVEGGEVREMDVDLLRGVCQWTSARGSQNHCQRNPRRLTQAKGKEETPGKEGVPLR